MLFTTRIYTLYIKLSFISSILMIDFIVGWKMQKTKLLIKISYKLIYSQKIPKLRTFPGIFPFEKNPGI